MAADALSDGEEQTAAAPKHRLAPLTDHINHLDADGLGTPKQHDEMGDAYSIGYQRELDPQEQLVRHHVTVEEVDNEEEDVSSLIPSAFNVVCLLHSLVTVV